MPSRGAAVSTEPAAARWETWLSADVPIRSSTLALAHNSAAFVGRLRRHRLFRHMSECAAVGIERRLVGHCRRAVQVP
jgi:hypothetical protein